MRRLTNLPAALYLLIMDYLKYAEQIYCSCSCKDWYQEFLIKFLRHVLIRSLSQSQREKTLRKLSTLIKNYDTQLTVRFFGNKTDGDLMNTFLSSEKIKRVICPTKRLLFIEKMNVKELELRKDGGYFLSQGTSVTAEEYAPIILILESKFSHLKVLEIDCFDCAVEIPFLPNLVNLSVSSNSHHSPVPLSYFQQLESLHFSNCAILEVNEMGSIPTLLFDFCYRVSDVSGLNNNRKVSIFRCDKIRDVTRSFENSQEINLTDVKLLSFNPSRWKKVTRLTLSDSSRGLFTNCSVVSDNLLPVTVKTCELSGSFVTIFDLSRSLSNPRMKLRALSLASNDQLTSLEGLGLEMIHSVTCSDLMGIRSLSGIGEGRNRKVSLRRCDALTDFSSLRYVEELSYLSFEPPSSAFQLHDYHHLRTLTLEVPQYYHVDPQLLPVGLEYLDIHSTFRITTYTGLERIPVIKLRGEHFVQFLSFLSSGGKLENHRIDFHLLTAIDWEVVYERYLAMEYLITNREKTFLSLIRRK